MKASLLQQLLHAQTPSAFAHEEVRNNVPYLMMLQKEQLAVGGAQAGMAAKMTNNTLFSTSRPDGRQHTIVPVTIDELGRWPKPDDPSFDSVAELAHSWERLMTAEQWVRLDQKLTQAQPDVTPHNKRATVHSMTPELVHPDTGESTEFIAYAFIPHDPSALQIKRGQQMAERLHSFVANREADQALYWRAPGQSFRHSALK